MITRILPFFLVCSKSLIALETGRRRGWDWWRSAGIEWIGEEGRAGSRTKEKKPEGNGLRKA